MGIIWLPFPSQHNKTARMQPGRGGGGYMKKVLGAKMLFCTNNVGGASDPIHKRQPALIWRCFAGVTRHLVINSKSTRGELRCIVKIKCESVATFIKKIKIKNLPFRDLHLSNLLFILFLACSPITSSVSPPCPLRFSSPLESF